jgi:SAM-dependent methyltransferase
MPDSKHSYVLSDVASAAEIKRLQQIDEMMGPTSRRRIEPLGIAPGWKCLEVGAGVGGVAKWMADRVGPSGKVTAIDLTPLFEADPAPPQLEVRRHDIRAVGLEDGAYDLVHCRLLLCNVGDVELTLKRMVQALRPGGWLVVEETGDNKLPGVGDSDPRMEEFNRLAVQFLQAVQDHAKAVEINLFRRLPDLFQYAGLVDIGGDLTYPLADSHGLGALLGTIQAMRPFFADSRLVRGGDLERLAELCSDPSLLTVGDQPSGCGDGPRVRIGLPSEVRPLECRFKPLFCSFGVAFKVVAPANPYAIWVGYHPSNIVWGSDSLRSLRRAPQSTWTPDQVMRKIKT